MSSASDTTSLSLTRSPSSSSHSSATVRAPSERLSVASTQLAASPIMPTPPIASRRSSSSRARGARLPGPSARGDQAVVARRVAQRGELLVEARGAAPAIARGQAAQEQRVRGRGAAR